jgi:putative acetyltransferase
MGVVQTRREALQSSSALRLIAALDGELLRRYPNRDEVPPVAQDAFTRLGDDEVAPGRGAFLVASVDGEDAGCGAVRGIGNQTGELKRMFVLPEYRARGVASALLSCLEAEASGLGIIRIVLEVATFSEDAIALYTKCGYEEIPLFGPYVGSPISLAMAKQLSDPS